MSRTPLFEREGYIICFEAIPECEDIIDHFKNECGWTAKECKGLEDLAWFTAAVSAWRDGKELSTKYLGCCAYKTAEEFYTVYRDDYFADMVEEAIQNAKGVTV